MSAPQFTPGPWRKCPDEYVVAGDGIAIARACLPDSRDEQDANAHLIAAAPDHALIGWAMCVQDARWEEWVPFDGKGEFCFAGLRYATSLDQFGIPKVTPALREAITASQQVPE